MTAPSSRAAGRPTRCRVERLEDRTTPVAFAFDYSLDTAGFFNDPVRRSLLQQAGDSIGARLIDSLDAVSVVNREIYNPANVLGSSKVAVTRSVPADTIVVYAGGGPLPAGALAIAGPSSADTRRGETGTYEFAPDVGILSVDNDGTSLWDTSTANGREEMRGVFRHELMHVLGIVSAQPSWRDQIVNGAFTGPLSKAANGNVNVPVTPDASHPAQGTRSIHQPIISDYRDLTRLDYALLDDIGWSVGTRRNSFGTAVPEYLSGSTGGTLVAGLQLENSGGVHLLRIDGYTGYRLTASTSAFQGSAHDTYLRLFNSAGVQITFDDDGGTDAYSSLEFTFAQSDTYYLGISLYANRDYDPVAGNNAAATARFNYGLSLEHVDVGGVIETAVPTGLSGGTGTFAVNAVLEDFTMDKDLYRVDGTAGATLTAATSLPADSKFPSDTYLRVFDAAGRELLARDDGGPGRYARLSYTLPNTGTYYVGVCSPRLVGGVGYDVTEGELGGDIFSSGGGEYRLTLSLSPSIPAGDGAALTGRDFPDLVARTPGGDWWVAQNSHGNNAGGSRQYGTWNEAAGWRDVRTLDLNRDGLTDVIGRTSGGGWWGGINRGVRFENVYLGQWNEAAGWRDVQAADVDGDGDLDVVGRTSGGAWFAALSQATAAGGFGLVNAYLGQWNEAAGWRDVRAVDFDGDGRTDLVGRTAGGAWWLGRSATNGTLVNSFLGQWNEAAGWRDVRLGDFTGDGRPDIAGRTAGGTWYVARNVGGTSLVSALVGQWNEAAGWRDVMVGDFAGDGRPDIIGRTSGGEWFVATAVNGGFENRFFGQWNEAAGWRDVMAGNFSGGGKADVVGRTAGGAWYVGRNDHPGFTSYQFAVWAGIEWRSTGAGFLSGSPGDTAASGGHGLGCACANCAGVMARLQYERGDAYPNATPEAQVAESMPLTLVPAVAAAEAAPAAIAPVAASETPVSLVAAPAWRSTETRLVAFPEALVARKTVGATADEFVARPAVRPTPPEGKDAEPADPLADALFAGIAV